MKAKKSLLLLTGLAGTLVATSAAGVALSSCSTSSSSKDVEYSYVIDWNDKNIVDRLIIDDNGLVYSDSAMTTVVAVSPKVKLATLKIPSRVKSIMGYAKVVYSDADGNLYDAIPEGESEDNYFKTYQSLGAFEGMTTLDTIILESDSNLQSIGAYAFSGCTALKTITGLASTLKTIGVSAFYNCTSLTSVDLSNVTSIANYAFQNCTSLTITNLDNVLSIGQYAFSGAFDSSATTAISLSNVVTIGANAFDSSNITSVDFSKNTSLNTIGEAAFQNCTSLTGTIDFSNCSMFTRINRNTFANDTALTTVYLPSESISNLSSIGDTAFSGCTALTTVAPSGQTGFVATSKISAIGTSAFAETPIKVLNISAMSITNNNSAFNSSFRNMHYVESVSLPSTLEKISTTMFNYVGDLGAGFDLVLPSSFNVFVVVSSGNAYSGGTILNSPFANSGLKSIDMSNITSYDKGESSSDETSLVPGTFQNATMLESVTLKKGTTRIWYHAFENCTSLKVVKEPDQTYTTGFTSSETLQTIQTDAFKNAFSAEANAAIDLSAMTTTTTPAAFSGSKIATLTLPTTTTTIAANSFDNTTSLTSVNFADLTELTTIYKGNFNNTQLTSIDLSNSKFSTISGTSGSLFTNLPTGAVVSLPNTIGNFSSVFTDTDGNPVTFSYPNGLNLASGFATVSSGVLTFASGQEQLSNLSSINLSSNDTVYSIGPNTFFGNTKLTSVTLGAKGISAQTTGNAAGLFSTTQTITTNTANTATATSYTKTNVPFGNNSALTALKYSNFTSTTGATATTTRETLFNTTDATTWAEIIKIMNSLSYKATATASTAQNYTPVNLSEWTVPSSGVTGASPIAADATATWANSSSSGNTTTPAQITIGNSYTATSGTSTSDIIIKATDSSKTIVHNGVTWTYANNGTTITLTARNVNMYKLTSASKNYITYFNENTVTRNGTTYYVPGKSVTVTLTVATAASTSTTSTTSK